MNVPPAPPDPAICPLCGKANHCAMEVQRATGTDPGPCWCTTVTFGAGLLARVPPAAQRRACVCATCATAQPPQA